MPGRTVVVAWAAAVALGTARPTPAPRAAPTTTLGAARAAQREFERRRRTKLPTDRGGGSGPCEVRIGRFCYWDNNGEPPPAEPASIGVLRDTLLARLHAAVRHDSTDDWIVGQIVRYDAEARRFDDGVAAANACAGTAWWCAALRGLAHHHRGDHAEASAAFDTALTLQPERERCRWTDISAWLDGALAREFKRRACGSARDAWLARFWPSARPLSMLPGNDLRSELFARRAMARIQSRSALTHDLSWGDDMAELELRYGWPVAWSASPPAVMSSAQSIVGHEPTPSYAFVPTRDAPIASPGAADADAWELDARLPLMRYAPRYLRHGMVPLEHQIARFRRGDSTLVIGAWDVAHDERWLKDTLPAPRDSAGTFLTDVLRAGLVLVDTSGHEIARVRDSVATRGTVALTVAPGAYLASLELLAQPRGRGARARYGVTSLPIDSLASDLLLLSRGAPPDAPLDSLLANALGTRTIAAGTPVGLYWETYFPPDTASQEVTVRATRIDAAWYSKLGRALRLDGMLGGGPQTPVAVKFVDPPRADASRDGVSRRTIALTWPREAVGTYRVEVTVRNGARIATTSETIRVR